MGTLSAGVSEERGLPIKISDQATCLEQPVQFAIERQLLAQTKFGNPCKYMHHIMWQW